VNKEFKVQGLMFKVGRALNIESKELKKFVGYEL